MRSNLGPRFQIGRLLGDWGSGGGAGATASGGAALSRRCLAGETRKRVPGLDSVRDLHREAVREVRNSMAGSARWVEDRAWVRDGERRVRAGERVRERLMGAKVYNI